MTRSDITLSDRKGLDACSILSLDNDCFACLRLGCRLTTVATLAILGAKISAGLVSLRLELLGMNIGLRMQRHNGPTISSDGRIRFISGDSESNISCIGT